MKVPPELHEEIVRRATAGSSCQAVASWLKEAHAISVSGEAVRKIVRKTRSERADVAKVVVREHIARTLPADLVALDAVQAKNLQLLEEAQRQAERELSVAAVEKVVKLTAAVTKADEVKKKALGLDQPDEAANGLAEILGLAFT